MVPEITMTPQDHETVILKLDVLIRDIQALIDRVEQHGVHHTLPEDYEQLLTILDSAVTQQREHTQAMLNESP